MDIWLCSPDGQDPCARRWLALLGLLLSLAGILAPSGAGAISYTPFGPFGEGGDLHGQVLEIGSGGRAFIVDSFVAFDGGGGIPLSSGSLAATLPLVFTPTLSVDETDLTLRYDFTNASGAVLTDVTFFALLDAEIDEDINGFFNEFGTVLGLPGVGQNFEIDDPGFNGGDLIPNISAGMLDGTNALPAGNEGDVALALSFFVGDLGIGESMAFDVLFSEDGDFLGDLRLQPEDADPLSDTVVTMSAVVVPEPGTLVLVAAGLLALAGRRR